MRGRRVDVGEPLSIEAALEGVGVVLSCIDQAEPHLLRAAIRRGLAHTDIAPHLMTRRPPEAMKAEAAQTGARIVLGAGLAPGISSMLARLGAERVGAVESVESNVLLSVGDTYGPASRAYLMEEIFLSYAARIEGRDAPMRPFAGSARVTSRREDGLPVPVLRSGRLSPKPSVPGQPSRAWCLSRPGSESCYPCSYGYESRRRCDGVRALKSDFSGSWLGCSGDIGSATGTECSWMFGERVAESVRAWSAVVRPQARRSARPRWCERSPRTR